MTQKLRDWLLIADLVWAAIALLIAYDLRYGWVSPAPGLRDLSVQYLLAVSVVLLVWTVLYSTMRLDGLRGGWHLPAALSQVFLGLALLMSILLALAFLAKQYYSRLVLLYFAGLLLAGFVTIRCVVHFLLHSRYRTRALQRVAILGNGRIAREMAGKIARHPEMMWEVVGFLYPSEPGSSLSRAGAVGSSTSIPTLGVLELLRHHKVQQLIAVMPLPSTSEIQKLIVDCRNTGIAVCLVPQWYQLYLSRTRLIEIDGLPLLSLHEHTPENATRAMQRVMDVIIGCLLLVFALPVLGVAAAALYLTKGRAFKREARCGKDGQPFSMYRLNVDRDDPGLTGLERLLAQLSLTELPQLWNVLRGDMALVGPRPESPERVKNYSDWQQQRLRVPPGLTGLAQVSGLREGHSSEEKALFDMQYIFNCNIFLDLSLILQTVWTVIIRLVRPAVSAAEPSGQTPFRDLFISEVGSADSSQSCAD